MKVGSTFIILNSVADKLDHLAIEKAVSQLDFPPFLSGYEKLAIAVIVRGDNVYPEEHYRVGNTLVVGLQFDPKKILSLTPEEVTILVRDRTQTYLSTITEVEERAYTMMEEI